MATAKAQESKQQSVAIVSDENNLPEHAKQGTGAGNENVSARDMVIPRLKLLQDLNPEVKANKPEYVEGAKPGLIYNTVTKSLSTELIVLNLYYDHGYVLFRNRDFGGGFYGNFSTYGEALDEAIKLAGNQDQAMKMFDITESARHTIGVIDPETGEIDPAMMDFTSTKLRVSSQWNTEIAQKGGDRFSGAWKVTVADQSNSKGDFFNYHIEFLGFVSDAIYQSAKVKYQEIRDSYAAGTAKVQDA